MAFFACGLLILGACVVSYHIVINFNRYFVSPFLCGRVTEGYLIGRLIGQVVPCLGEPSGPCNDVTVSVLITTVPRAYPQVNS